jgi:hypothetical protein
MSTEAAFTVGSMKGAGKGMSKGPSTAYYKIEKPTSNEPTEQAPAPEPEAPAESVKDKGPVVHSPEVAQAKERVKTYQQQTMDGSAGADFSTESSTAGTNGISFEPGKIDTPAYDPNPDEEEAQNFADKYKLGLINKGTSNQSDFSAV